MRKHNHWGKATLQSITIALVLALAICNVATADTMATTQVTEVFQYSDDGKTIVMVDELPAGTAYEWLDWMEPPSNNPFATFYTVTAPIQWSKIQYKNANDFSAVGWIVSNPVVITGINAESMSLQAENTASWNAPEQYGFVLCQTLSVRQEPDLSASIILTLQYSDICQIIEESASWYRVGYTVNSQSITGWVKKDYVLTDFRYFVTDQETPVYAYPDTSAKRIALLEEGESVTIITEWGDFFVISLRGASGFIARTSVLFPESL